MEPPSGPRPRASLAVIALVALVLSIATSTASADVTVTDVNPDTSTVVQNVNATSGGRVNGMDVAPGSNLVAYAASEWGGVYKTTDGGANWVHLDAHLPQATWDVMVNPGNPDIVYATSFYDGRVDPLSGIAVSFDGGDTWDHPASGNPGVGQCGDPFRQPEPSAFGISVRPDQPQNVAIGTNCGLALSTDFGATWNFVAPATGVQTLNVWDVQWQAGGANGILDICGDGGHQRSTTGGASWTASLASPFPAGICTLAPSPLETAVMYGMSSTALWEGMADGLGVLQWTQLCGPASAGAPCNLGLGTRQEFVETNQTAAASFDLYVGARTNLNRITGCDNASLPTRCPLGTLGAVVQTGAHLDPGDVVFDRSQAVPRCPLLYSNDGGIYKNSLGAAPACLNPSWARSMVGLHATWLWTMDGADLGAATGVYFGLQDDGFWGTADDAANWANPDCCDVFDTSRTVPTSMTRCVAAAVSNPRHWSVFRRTRLVPLLLAYSMM